MAKSRRRPQQAEVPEEMPQTADDAGALRYGGDTTATPDRERIAERAYEIYISRGGTDGRAMEDWLEAERELLKQR